MNMPDQSAQPELELTPPAAEAAAPAETPAAAPTEAEVAAGNTERDDKGRFRNPLQPRIDELTKARREAERERDYWRSQAAARANPPPEPPKKPTPDQFDSYDQYVEALTDWKADQKIDEKLTKRDEQTTAQTQAQRRAEAWAQRVQDAAKVIPDLNQVLAASEVRVSDAVTELLLESDLGPQIAYHLDRNPDLAEKLNAMSPTQAAREIGRLEVKLAPSETPAETRSDAPSEPVTESAHTQAPAVQNRRVSAAPPPVKPVSQGRATQVDLAKAGMEEFVKTRKSQGASWAR